MNPRSTWRFTILSRRSPLPPGVGIAMGVVGAFGFDPSVKDSIQGVTEMGRVALFMAGAIALFGVLLLYGYPLTAKRHAIVRRWVSRKTPVIG